MDYEEIDDLLQSPYGLYEKMRQGFLKKCQDGSVGKIAIELNEYLDKTEEYGKIHDMEDTITEENINIVRYLVWSMPRELRKKLLEIEDAEKESNEDLLRAMSYQIFEHEKPYHVAKAMAANQAYLAERNAAK